MADTRSPDDAHEKGPPVETAFRLVAHQEHLLAHAIATAATHGIFDQLSNTPTAVEAVATDLGLDLDNTHRLLRALASFEVLTQHEESRYSLTPVGERFQSEHPESLRDFAMFLYAPARLAAVKHFPAVVATGAGTGYDHEYGEGLFDYCADNPEFARAFNGFQDVSSIEETDQIIEVLSDYDFAPIETVCDVGGGYGSLVAKLLVEYPDLEGTVLELPSVLEDEERLWARKLGVERRCRYVAGDMFESVPTADLYILKAIIHDWSDEACVDVLSTIRAAAPADGRLLVRDRVIDEGGISRQTAIMDLWMLLETGGRERTLPEFESLFQASGWELHDTYGMDDDLRIMEAVVANEEQRN